MTEYPLPQSACIAPATPYNRTLLSGSGGLIAAG